MTPFTHLTNDTHIATYQAELRTELARARTASTPLHSLRTHIARGLVRAGAWLLPDKPEVIGGTVIVFSDSRDDPAAQRAA